MDILNNKKNDDAVTKNDLRIISKHYAHLQTMTLTPVKFQENWHNTLGEVACTRYLASIHFGQKND